MHDNKINVVRTILDQPAFPPAALPVVTFDDRIELYFGNERLELVHVSPAHTAGDVAVILRDQQRRAHGRRVPVGGLSVRRRRQRRRLRRRHRVLPRHLGASTATRSSCRATADRDLRRARGYIEMLEDRARPHRRADRRRCDARSKSSPRSRRKSGTRSTATRRRTSSTARTRASSNNRCCEIAVDFAASGRMLRGLDFGVRS